MRPIDHFDLHSFDLNLLVAFDALMQERSVTAAAARLRLGQPALSHALSTLRVLLGDPLFVRAGGTMRPTLRAERLAPRIRDALTVLQFTLRDGERFDPASEDRTFRLGFSSELEVLLLPDLATRFRDAAPRIRVLGRTVDGSEAPVLLDTGELDLVVGCFPPATERHRGRPLFEQSLCCCFDPGRLDLPVPIDRERYLALPHVVMTRRDDLQGCLSDALRRSGATLNVVAAASDFLAVLAVAAASPVLATLPSRMAERYAPRFGLLHGPVPLDLAVPAVSLLWSVRTDRDPGSSWLREAVTAALEEPPSDRKVAA